MDIDNIIRAFCNGKNEKQVEGCLKFLSDKIWNLYTDYLMDKVLIIENEMNKWAFNLPNAKEGCPYEKTCDIPQKLLTVPEAEIRIDNVAGLSPEQQGLSIIVADDKKSFTISGTPTLDVFRKDGATPESTFELTFSYSILGMDIPEEKCHFERKIPFIINQDPRKLWKNLPVDWGNMPEPKYRKEDTQCEYVKVEKSSDGVPQKDIVAASKRGRSHAQESKPRDDHFRVEYMPNGWYIMAVADGAGSAKYSREGSHIACDTTVDHCKLSLINSKPFETAIEAFHLHEEENNSEARKVVGDYIYQIVGTAAFKAHRAIVAEATIRNLPVKQYATTLLLTICKHFSFGWFVASFWVGDGAICLYNRQAHTAKILGIPDEGEYAGQTRFLTMQEIFQDTKTFYQRLRFSIMDDFTALFLMSDGVSDPKFETDANLNNPDKWDALWDDLHDNGVELIDDNEEAKEQLLNWLDFWSAGNHDDRTIAILYGQEHDNTNDTADNMNTQSSDISDIPAASIEIVNATNVSDNGNGQQTE